MVETVFWSVSSPPASTMSLPSANATERRNAASRAARARTRRRDARRRAVVFVDPRGAETSGAAERLGWLGEPERIVKARVSAVTLASTATVNVRRLRVRCVCGGGVVGATGAADANDGPNSMMRRQVSPGSPSWPPRPTPPCPPPRTASSRWWRDCSPSRSSCWPCCAPRNGRWSRSPRSCIATGWSALLLFLARASRLNPMSATLGTLVIAVTTEFSVLLSERDRAAARWPGTIPRAGAAPTPTAPPGAAVLASGL